MFDYEKLNDCVKSGIFGLVVADALGVPYEFNSRDFCDRNPMADMIGYGTYNQPEGTWSDDSSIALACLDGLSNFNLKENLNDLTIENFSEIFDYTDIMTKIANWRYKKDYTPHGEVFDIGGTTRDAIYNFHYNGVDALLAGGDSPRDNGNGSLMRILPIAFVIYFLSLKYEFSQNEEMKTIHNLSSLTHRHIRSQMACGIYVKIAIELLKNKFEESEDDLTLLEIVNRGISNAKDYYLSDKSFVSEIKNFEDVFSLDIHNFPREEISGSGYVINCLNAALWCLLNNDNYRETALAAVNLGEDTDTTAAVVGGLAGIYYSFDDIPQGWLNKIAKYDFIDELIAEFSKNLYDVLED